MADDEAFLHDVYDMLHIFGDKWTIPVMVALSDGPLRPSEILSRVNGYRVDENWPDRHAVLHDSILARSLARMTAIGLLSRTSADSFPPKVIYALEPPATEFLELLAHAFGWPRQHAEVVSRAQVFHLGRKAAGDPSR
ncbi:winged helix-turn-helix transcriptional regulator [Pseudonocardia sichuanensis]|uniref:HxlR family transcriptional regulator n=1 Tax=Pseudonocardia kunmingensis TaxID=630975 RepID=A0A543D9J1_9PSEU|nr:helix-turn-helix domain-containing protein [Pseudonocardia kunmingensis]TQM06009.1 HxlR family transcriptional regulator [Pseudonocardia kunmingensis]